MPKYVVSCQIRGIALWEIEADSEEQAEEIWGDSISEPDETFIRDYDYIEVNEK